MSLQHMNGDGLKYSIEHCLFFAHPAEDRGTIFLSGRCAHPDGGDTVTIEVLDGEKMIGRLSPNTSGYDLRQWNAEDPSASGFCAYIPMDERLEDGKQVKLAFQNEGADILCVDHDVSDIQKHMDSQMNHSDIHEAKKAKLANLLLNETERVHHVKGVASSPVYLQIGPYWERIRTGPDAKTDPMRISGHSLEMMSKEVFRKMLDRFGEKLILAYVVDWDKPCLDANAMDHIQTLKDCDIRVTVCSRFSHPCSDQEVDNLFSSGIDHLIASIDAASEETYAQYNDQGALALTLEHVQRIIKARQERAREDLRIRWRFTRFDWNSHEVETAAKRSEEMGFDEFEVIRGDDFKNVILAPEVRDNSFMDAMKPEIWELMTKYCEERKAKAHYFGCDNLYRQMVINADGSVHPCRFTHELRHRYGSIHSKMDIFNSAFYKNARGQYAKVPPKQWQGYDPCLNCWIVTDENYKGYVPSALDFFSAYERVMGKPLTI